MKRLLLTLLLSLCPLSAWSMPPTVVYQLDAANADQQRLPEWLRSGAWAPPVNVLDFPSNAALGRWALFLEATTYGGGTNSRLVGDTGVVARAGSRYALSFLLQRTDTLTEGAEKNKAPYFSGLVYQLWAGHPENGGMLLAEGRAQPYAIDESPQNIPLTLTTPPLQTSAKGILHIRFATEVSPAPGIDAYQQAELYDVQLSELR
jgi:hypothetical protein